MSSDVVLSVRNVSKCFEMYEKPVHRLYQTLCAGKKKFYKEFWALKDISFDVHRGECVGIIGRNGAGKSTLLQVITGTLAATGGSVDVNGRIAALLELGSGFNPEFTGRENVYLNASILGLAKEEIDRRYDEIVAFADIGDFIDQPVKTYSSGMMVRLAFAVNVYVDPEILIVDEALAVGDAAFQLKCADRMKSLLAQKVTILFVSHDINSVRTYCNRAIWMKNGRIEDCGDVKEITTRYMEDLFAGRISDGKYITAGQSPAGMPESNGDGLVGIESLPGLRRWGTGEVRVESFSFTGYLQPVEYGQELRLTVRVRTQVDVASREGISCAFSIRNSKALDIVCCTSRDEGIMSAHMVARNSALEFSFVWRNELKAGDYVLVIAAENHGNQENLYFDYLENAVEFTVLEQFPIYALTRPSCRMDMKGEV